MNIRTTIGDVETVHFCDVEIGHRFATFANNEVVVWIKLRDGRNFLNGESDDGYTCPVENSVTTTDGFSAIFNPKDLVMKSP